MKILFDADSLIALKNPKDALHNKASLLLHKLNEQVGGQFVTWDVIDEVSTKLRYQFSKNAATEFLSDIFNTTFVVIYPSEDLVKMARKIFLEIPIKHTSLTDCMNIAVYQKLEMDVIFSFDKLYQKQGLKVLQMSST